jgi:uncharacterized protein (DUF3820 family)
MTLNPLSDKEYLIKFTAMKMPFGKYAGRLLIDLPEPYVVWFKQKGFPKGQLGEMFELLYEIKVNGLEYLFDPIRKNKNDFTDSADLKVRSKDESG